MPFILECPNCHGRSFRQHDGAIFMLICQSCGAQIMIETPDPYEEHKQREEEWRLRQMIGPDAYHRHLDAERLRQEEPKGED